MADECHIPMCRGRGRIFGGWAACIHGARGRLAEIEKEAAELRLFILANEPHDCSPLLPIGVLNASPWTCPECEAQWFYAAGPLEGDWFRAEVPV